MSETKNDKLKTTLRQWYIAQQEIKKLENRIKECKLEITREMNRLDVDRVTAGGYTVTRTRTSRKYISRNSVPVGIWEEYATQCNYDIFRLRRA